MQIEALSVSRTVAAETLGQVHNSFQRLILRWVLPKLSSGNKEVA
jgi:hypothetical protein